MHSDDDEVIVVERPPTQSASFKTRNKTGVLVPCVPSKRKAPPEISPQKRLAVIEILDSDEELDADSHRRRMRKGKSVARPNSAILSLSDDDADSSAGKKPVKRVQSIVDLTADDEPVAGPSSRPLINLGGLGVENKTVEVQAILERAARINPKQQRSDEALARKLAAQEERELQKVLSSIEKKTEGIVFRVVVDIDSGRLEDGTPAHSDDLERFRSWQEKFKGVGMKVKKFHWIVNYELEKRFEKARDTLRMLMGKEPEELEMFHGTAAHNIDSILSGGFRIGGVGRHKIINGAALGHGIYLASNPAMSLGYCVGGNRMFACRVLPGRITAHMGASMQLPKTEVGAGEFETFSSGHNHILVVRHTDLVLPCYMIEWDAPQYNAGLGGMFGGNLNRRGPLAGPLGPMLPRIVPHRLAPPPPLPPPLLQIPGSWATQPTRIRPRNRPPPL
ncbi:PARP catalytic domain-containing protein [Mycena kentingensis (nom. inval.)]|nr:PARP catalytic domain-containing protein [Mycena kentingensis (nom. inval.)]